MADENEGTIVTEEDKVFSENFDKALGVGDEKPPETPPAEPEKPPEEPAKPPEVPPVKDPETPPAQPEDFEQKWKSLDGIVRKKDTEIEELRKEHELTKARLAEAEKKLTPPTPPENKASDQERKTFSEILKELNLTPEQEKALKDYEEEFDLVSQMEGLKRDKALEKLRAEFAKEIEVRDQKILSQLDEKFKPAAEFITKSEKERDEEAKLIHFQMLEEAHPDYKEYVKNGSMTKWIETLPSYMREAAKNTYQKGKAEDVIELISDFKKANNIAVITQPSNVVNMNDKKQEKLKALSVPTGKRGAVNTQRSVATGFDDSWDEALAKEK